jgi:hypothetical protein
MKKSQLGSMILMRGVVPATLILLLACSPGLSLQAAAEDHIVSSQALQQQMVNSSAARQKDAATVTGFLASSAAEHALRSAHMDPVQIRTAIPTLSNQELANLATRASDTQQKFAGGMISTGMLELIIVLIAVIIIVAAIH